MIKGGTCMDIIKRLGYVFFISAKEMKSILLIILFVGCSLQSCINNEKKIKEIALKEDIKIDEFSDSTFFSDIRSITFSDNSYYVTDYSRDQLFILDKGQGPGEFLGAAHIYINRDSVFVMNDMKQSFELFRDLKYIETIPYANSTRPNSNHRFFEYNGCLFYNPSVSKYSICKYNFKTKKNEMFGRIEKYETEKETRIKNHRHLLRYDNRIIAIPDCKPIIEVYDFKGNLVNIVDFSHVEPVAKMLKFIQGTEQKENSYYGFNEDVVIYKSSLYILILTSGVDNIPKSNTILKFNIEGDNFEPSCLYDLGNGYFNTINVSKQGIETYNVILNQLKRYHYDIK